MVPVRGEKGVREEKERMLTSATLHPTLSV